MLIAIYALLSWLSIFDGGDIKNEKNIKIVREQNVKIINEDKKIGIAAYKNIYDYGLDLYYLNNNMGKYGVYSIISHMDDIDEHKKK